MNIVIDMWTLDALYVYIAICDVQHYKYIYCEYWFGGVLL